MPEVSGSLRKIPVVGIVVTAASSLVAVAITLSPGNVGQAQQPEETTKALQVEKQAPEIFKPALDINWKTTRLGTIPKKYKQIISILFGPDGRRVAAIVAEKEIDSCFLIDGNSETEIYCL